MCPAVGYCDGWGLRGAQMRFPHCVRPHREPRRVDHCLTTYGIQPGTSAFPKGKRVPSSTRMLRPCSGYPVAAHFALPLSCIVFCSFPPPATPAFREQLPAPLIPLYQSTIIVWCRSDRQSTRSLRNTLTGDSLHVYSRFTTRTEKRHDYPSHRVVAGFGFCRSPVRVLRGRECHTCSDAGPQCRKFRRRCRARHLRPIRVVAWDFSRAGLCMARGIGHLRQRFGARRQWSG